MNLTETTPDTLLTAILSAADKPREQSITLPAAAYTDPAFAEFEKTEIFSKEWISLCHISQIPNAGDFVRIDLCGEPMLVVRGKDMAIKVFSRTCRHRGMDLMPSGFGHPDEGNKRMILCPYHLWSYDLSGKLLGAPEMQQAEGFDRSEVCLHEFRSEIWEGFVFTTLSETALPLTEKYARLRESILGKSDMADAQLVWSAHWECDFNWKILIENFMEAYHHMGAHQKTLEPFLPARGCWAEPYDPEFSCMHLPLRKNLREKIQETDSPETAFPVFQRLTLQDCTEWFVFLGFPNFLIFSAPDRIYWYRVLPTGPQSCTLMTTMLVSKAAKEIPNYDEILKKEIQAGIDFHMEDMEVCTATQRGMNSAGYSQGRLSHLEETIWHFEKYLAGVIKRSQDRT